MAALEQHHRVLDFDVCRENEDRHIRVLLSDCPGSVETLCRVGWRHTDVDDRKIGPLFMNEPHELGSVARLTDDLVPALLEQARDALAHQYVVVSDDDSYATRIDFGHGESIPQHDWSNQAKPR
jgi:hypothetical protein